jgi:hypothetical protein
MVRMTLRSLTSLGIILTTWGVLCAQQAPSISVPRYINYHGVVSNGSGQPSSGIAGVTFAIYKDQQGGTPLWIENQNVLLDAQGLFTVLLGATTTGGLPLELFAGGEPRWLGVQAQLAGQAEQPRILLVSVPYALKAADADTIGGKPLSAFVLADPLDQTAVGETASPNVVRPRSGTVTGGTGTTNVLTKWLNGTGLLGDSLVYEVNGKVGVNNPNPVGQFDLAGASSLGAEAGGLHVTDTNVSPNKVIQIGYDDAANVGFVRAYQSGTDVEKLVFNPQGGNVGVGTTNPVGQFDISTQATYNQEAGGFHITNNATNPSKVTQVGYDNNIDAGFVRAYQTSTALKPLLLNPGGGFVGVATTAPTHALEVNGTARVAALMFGDNTSMTTAAASLAGTNVFTGNQTVNGNVQITGGSNSVIFADGSSLSSANPARIRTITYLGGCDTCSVLADTDDQRTIYLNLTGAMTINSVTCYSDAGTPTINLQRDDGSPANILSADLQCSTTGATSVSIVGAESILNLGDKIDFVMSTAGGTAKRVTVAIKATVN